jgi:NAD(P)-dependent dehydrogenase (short-subunit alcohol dehydrogenase family)
VEGLLVGRKAVVTGGARGIGRAIVETFAKHGAIGMVLDTAPALGRADLPEGFDGQIADVTREAEIAEAMTKAAQAFDGIDIVVANAGIVPPWHETSDLDLEEFERTLAVNARGIAATIKHAVPAMQARGGAIIATASINAVKGHARQLAYTASKHAVYGIVQCAALDLGRFNIRVNAIAPGPVLTDALRERIRYRHTKGGPTEQQAARELASETPLNRLAREDDIANGALFLSSDLAKAITGHMLVVDSGFLL